MRKDLGSSVSRLEDKLATLRGQVRQAQQLAAMGTAAAMIAHEANNLLTPIVNYAQQALESENHALQQKALKVASQNAMMLVAMSERILRISAADHFRPEAVSVAEAVDLAAESLCRDLAKDGIKLVNQIPAGLEAMADRLSLRQVFFNLFLNAREALKKQGSGRLTVTARRERDDVVIEVADNGGGVPPELLPHIFDPLQSSANGKAQGQARCKGLGLALCRNLVEEMAGRITVDSTQGEGTVFTIRLPHAEAAVSA